jgi:hypothetical protein
LVVASERLRALAAPLTACSRALADALDVAPELQPELDAANARIAEAIGHVVAAQGVLKARLALLRDEAA